MPLTIRKLGDVLLHIYDLPFEAGIYLPEVVRYEADTPCVVSSEEDEDGSFHQMCLHYGFKNWLNVAVVSDTCDDVSPQTEPCLVAASNEACREGKCLWKMLNYRRAEK